MTFSGWVATLAGWYVTEIGRQPWLVYRLLTTADAASDRAGADDRHHAGRATWCCTPSLIVAYVTVLFHLARKAGAGKPAAARYRPGRPAAAPQRSDARSAPCHDLHPT